MVTNNYSNYRELVVKSINQSNTEVTTMVVVVEATSQEVDAEAEVASKTSTLKAVTKLSKLLSAKTLSKETANTVTSVHSLMEITN